MNHSQNDGYLHLESVQKDNLVLRDLPNGINSKPIWRTIPLIVKLGIDHVFVHVQDLVFPLFDLPRRSKNVDGLGKDVVVDQPRVNGEHGHDGDQVPAVEKVVEHLTVDFSGFQHFFCKLKNNNWI